MLLTEMQRAVVSFANHKRQLRARILSRPRRALLAFAVIPLAFAILIALPCSAFAQASEPTESDVEAAYLYRFGNFVQWPAGTRTDNPKLFPICVLGRDRFGTVLDNMVKGSEISGIPLAAKRIAASKDAESCRIVFISPSEDRRLESDLAVLRGSPVLTVSSIPDFTLRGGMIQFLLVDHRVRFEINLSNAQRAGLTVSSQLLKVAVVVRSDRKPKE